jgi:hypothetical protein
MVAPSIPAFPLEDRQRIRPDIPQISGVDEAVPEDDIGGRDDFAPAAGKKIGGDQGGERNNPQKTHGLFKTHHFPPAAKDAAALSWIFNP